MGCVPVCPCLCLIGCLALFRACGFSWTCGFGDFRRRLFLHPSHFRCSVSFLRGATTFCFLLLVLWQAGFAGIRVGEASNPGPNSASDGVTTPLPVSQDRDLVDILAVAVSPPQSFAPAAAPAPPLGALLPNPCVSRSPPARPPSSRPSRFCSDPRSGAASRRPSCPARTARARSRSPLPLPAPDDQSSCPRLVSPLVSFAWFLRALTIPLPLMVGPRSAVDAHLAGQLSGDIPADWLRGQGFSTCEVCQRFLSLRFNGRCPSCFRTLVARPASSSLSSRPLAEGAPGIWDVFVSDKRVRSSVPGGARDAWSRCLISALADVVAHRDVKSWTDFLTLPALVLPAPLVEVAVMFFGMRVRCVADVWTGSAVFGVISGPRRLPGR